MSSTLCKSERDDGHARIHRIESECADGWNLAQAPVDGGSQPAGAASVDHMNFVPALQHRIVQENVERVDRLEDCLAVQVEGGESGS